MKSPLAYIGGKSKLSKQIRALIPEHHAYCEVFAGGAWIFFSKQPSRVEVINDLDSDLVSFYRVIEGADSGFDLIFIFFALLVIGICKLDNGFLKYNIGNCEANTNCNSKDKNTDYYYSHKRYLL